MNVLIVDDSAALAQALQWILAHEGHNADIMIDAAPLLDPKHEAWQGLDVLICDLLMPDVSGVDVLAVAVKHHPSVKRICLTGAVDTPSLANQVAKIALVLPKPSDFQDILAAVGETRADG